MIYTSSRLEFLPNRLVPVRSGRRVRAPAQRPVRGTSLRYGDITPAHTVQAGGICMKAVVSLLLVFALVCSAAPPTYAEPRQVLQGTEIHLTLINGLNSSSAREGDPFIAVLAQPVALDSRIILPAGTRVHGIIGTIQHPKQFAMFRGQAYMNLTFKSMEIDSRLIPVQMSLLAIGQPRVNSDSKRRHDVKIVEGEVVEQKHDYK